MSRRGWGLALFVAAGLALVAFLRPGDESEVDVVEDVELPSAPSAPAPSPARAAAERSRDATRPNRPRPGRMIDEAPFPASPPGTVSAIESYLARTIYPPESQPLDPARHAERIEWNARRDAARRVPDDPDVSVLYTADVYTVFGREPVRSRLRVRRGEEPVDVTVLEAVARIEASDLAEAPPPVTLTYAPAGDEAPGELWNTFVPAEVFAGVETSVRLRFDLTFTQGESQPRRVNLDFAWSPGASGRFTGQFREAIEDGSLVIYAEVAIAAPGLYNIDANLWDSEDQPVAFARFKDELPEGTQEVPLRFFGAVLAESRAVPPFELRELHGRPLHARAHATAAAAHALRGRVPNARLRPRALFHGRVARRAPPAHGGAAAPRRRPRPPGAAGPPRRPPRVPPAPRARTSAAESGRLRRPCTRSLSDATTRRKQARDHSGARRRPSWATEPWAGQSADRAPCAWAPRPARAAR